MGNNPIESMKALDKNHIKVIMNLIEFPWFRVVPDKKTRFYRNSQVCRVGREDESR